MPRRGLGGPARLAVVLLLLATAADARDPGDPCLRSKLRASKVTVAALLRCGTRPDDAECTVRARDRLAARLAAADARAAKDGFACPGSAASLGLDGPGAWPPLFVERMAGGDGGRCARARIVAASRYAAAWTRCRAGDPLASILDVDACASGARSAFVRGWQSASDDGDCTILDVDPLDAAARVEDELEDTVSRLVVRCGDGRVAGLEECDDGGVERGDGCDADCRVETCIRDGDDVACATCPPDAILDAATRECRCPDGFEGGPGDCRDIDECATGEGVCGDGRPCVNLRGTWACAVECTAAAFHAAIASCGAPSGAIAFDCTDTTIAIPAGTSARRRSSCDGLVVDGAGRGIAFESAPLCWQTRVPAEDCPRGLEADGTCACPDVDDGPTFLSLDGDGVVVRDLTVRGFFDGIRLGGRDGLVEDLRFERNCDDAFGSVGRGVGNVFRRVEAREGCDKCSENNGRLGDTDPDPRVMQHWNAVFEDVQLLDCRTPVRMASTGRFLLRDVAMRPGEAGVACDGPRFSATPAAGRLFVKLERAIVEDCRRGVRFGRAAEGVLAGSVVRGCALRGLRVAAGAEVSVEGSAIVDNGGEGSTEAGFGGVAVLGAAMVDLGGGAMDFVSGVVRSRGGNALCGNLGPEGLPRQVDNATAFGVAAEWNWWCTTSPPWVAGLVGPVDPVPWLLREP